jgi:AhpD family alkylhydroperoxidase
MMVEGALDPLVREMIYIAVSTANGCAYCIHSHSAAARARGMTDAQHAELIAVIGLAGQTNHLVTAMSVSLRPRRRSRVSWLPLSRPVLWVLRRRTLPR